MCVWGVFWLAGVLLLVYVMKNVNIKFSFRFLRKYAEMLFILISGRKIYKMPEQKNDFFSIFRFYSVFGCFFAGKRNKLVQRVFGDWGFICRMRFCS